MAPRRRVQNKEDPDRSADYYIRKRNEFDESKLTQRVYGDASTSLQNVVKALLNKYQSAIHAKYSAPSLTNLHRYCATVNHASTDFLKTFSVGDLHNFFYYLIRESEGRLDSARSLQTYWNVLCIVREMDTGGLKVDPLTKAQMIAVRQRLVIEFNMRTEHKVKPIMRAEDLFEYLKTLWESTQMPFDMETPFFSYAINMWLSTCFATRTGERPRLLVEWKFKHTKGYLGEKQANTFTVPDIPSEPCILLCAQTTFLALAFLDQAFAAPDLTSPEQLYSLNVLPGQNQQPLPWREEMEDVPLFRKSERTAHGIELSSDTLPYSTLRPRMRTLGEVTGIELPVGAYCFRRGNGEALDNSSFISDSQRNLILQHSSSQVFQHNYLSRHITADTQAAYRGLPPQVTVMRAATGMSRTIDKRRPRALTPEQVREAHRHLEVQNLFRIKEDLKTQIKSRGRTISSFQGTKIHDEYKKAQRAYLSEFEYQKKALLSEVKRRYRKEQPVTDIQRQIHGPQVQEEKDVGDERKHLLPERVRVIDALFTFATSSPEEERKHRVEAINALVALGHVQDGFRRPASRQKGLTLSPIPKLPELLPIECKPTQCFLCLGNKKAPLQNRVREFHSRGDLKKHLYRYHISRHQGGGPIIAQDSNSTL
ncbi:hypothetical protein H2199_001975 [Coniosporium tulheliwenetii]|uniref:Uncharacterized protein n=1 Tax=Coniosporium tulheliwenetii TaxID=3383036 RepID=A0ACC2ZHH5_9PEZI|nr:hypothetical protein H2199_001975 [Cladosporium sp. JES 115]